MKSTAFRMTQLAGALAVISVAAACSTWDSMTHNEQATGVGAASGAVGGAVVAGPVGAVVGGVAGGVVGHEAAKNEYGSQVNRTADNTTTGSTTDSTGYNSARNERTNKAAAAPNLPQPSSTASNSAGIRSQQNNGDTAAVSASAEGSSDGTIRSAQQALSDLGFDPGPVDGLMGPKTAAAIRKFQGSNGLRSTGRLDSATVAALHLPEKAAAN